MAAKKKAGDQKTEAAIDEMRKFVAAGQAAQAAAKAFEDPEKILERFGDEVMEYCRRLKRHQLQFQERKMNPFRRLQEICQQTTLKLLDNFDKVAGMKAK